MSRTEAASRLGMPMIECVECDRTVRRTSAMVLMLNSQAPPMNVSGGRFTCSLRCVIERAKFEPGFLRCYRWNELAETWHKIGARTYVKRKWGWTDTGESIWLEENAALLREAGEIR